MTMTITEALAELKTLKKRIEKKREFVKSYLLRQDRLRDPLEKDGGSVEAIRRENQAVADLEKRYIAIRVAIAKVNDATALNVDPAKSMTVSEWLYWRREIAPGLDAFYKQLQSGIANARSQAMRAGVSLTNAGEATRPDDIVVNMSEADLAKEVETLETVLGNLDGKLSLLNATTMVEV